MPQQYIACYRIYPCCKHAGEIKFIVPDFFRSTYPCILQHIVADIFVLYAMMTKVVEQAVVVTSLQFSKGALVAFFLPCQQQLFITAWRLAAFGRFKIKIPVVRVGRSSFELRADNLSS